MKLLWVSNAPWAASGYGSQTRQVGRRIKAAGHEIEFSANDGTRGDQEWEGSLVRGSGLDRYSRDTVAEDLRRSGADHAIVLYDPWVFTDRVNDPFDGMANVSNWTPVDHYPLSPAMIPWLREHRSIAMSRYGFERLTEASEQIKRETGHGFPVAYAPHAIEPTFRPTPLFPSTGVPFREMIGVPDDAYLVGIVAANTGGLHYDRKGFGDMILGLAAFIARHPDTFVYFHTLQQGAEGINLVVALRVLGIDQRRIRWADAYLLKKQAISDEGMAAIYSSFDVLLATSRGEGFGIPVIEAQACGVPVIVSNWTAQTELVRDRPWDSANPGADRTPSGWMVAVQPDWNPKHAACFGKPNIGEISLALEDAYRHKGDAELRAGALAKAADYAADTVFDTYWRPILADISAEGGRVSAAREKRERRNAKRRAA